MAPCIVFIDEIDAVAGRRGVDNNSEREQTINQLLTEMDGFDSTDNILVIAATNQIEKLDPAILRPGRFDRQIMVHLPDINGREKILNIYLEKTKTDKTVISRDLAKITAGFSGADLANLVNEAILYAARQNKDLISLSDLVWAKDKITMGSERKVEVSNQDREQTAYHEIGHALIAKKLGVGVVSGVSIIPRGKALGVTQMEQVDVLTLTKQQAIHQIAMMMGGRVAEKIFFNHLSTGAVNDLQRAHALARSVIVTWGMSDLGPLAADDHQYKFLSDATKQTLDQEIITLVTAGEQLALNILTKHKRLVKKISLSLLEKENLSARDFAKLAKHLK
jgi:cell division protease FtsH